MTGPDLKKEATVALLYFVIYLSYLFWNPENELMHWLTLVMIPLALTYWLQWKQHGIYRGLVPILESFGLKNSTLRYGILQAIGIGLLLCLLQLFLSRDGNRILQLFQSGAFVYKFPIALLLMFLTAGFTEEFFFRGFLQTRLEALFSNKITAVLICSFCFGMYHLPYAYLNPHWPSHGNWPDALSSALGQGIPMGLILGTVYIRFRNNLLACITIHSLVNSFPAMLAIRF